MSSGARKAKKKEQEKKKHTNVVASPVSSPTFGPSLGNLNETWFDIIADIPGIDSSAGHQPAPKARLVEDMIEEIAPEMSRFKGRGLLSRIHKSSWIPEGTEMLSDFVEEDPLVLGGNVILYGVCIV